MTPTDEQLAEWDRKLDAWHADERSRWPRADVDVIAHIAALLLAEVRRLRAAPVGYTQAMALWNDGFAALATPSDDAAWPAERREAAVRRLRAAPVGYTQAIVFEPNLRAIGTSAQVAEAERAYLDACYAVDAVINEPTGAWAVASRAREDAWLALRRAREEASR